MKSSIVAGITDEGLEKEVRMNFLSSSIIRKRIRELISNKETSAYKDSVSSSAYDNPNWAFKQADTAGYIRALREIASLLDD